MSVARHVSAVNFGSCLFVPLERFAWTRTTHVCSWSTAVLRVKWYQVTAVGKSRRSEVNWSETLIWVAAMLRTAVTRVLGLRQ